MKANVFRVYVQRSIDHQGVTGWSFCGKGVASMPFHALVQLGPGDALNLAQQRMRNVAHVIATA